MGIGSILPALAALLLATGSQGAHAQSQRIFRCVMQGHVVFQQSACPTNTDAKVLDVKPGNVVAAPQRPRATAASAPQAAAAPAPAARSALDAQTEACLDHVRPFLRDPRSAYASGASREGRVLTMTVHATNTRGGVGSRKAACEFFNGLVDAGWTKIHLQRLGWFQPKVVIIDKHPQRPHHPPVDDIELSQG
jgi:Domain of unknown function (DUF4124)